MASIRQRGSRFQVMYREHGKQTSKSFGTQAEAQAFASKFDRPDVVHRTEVRGELTVAGYLARWLPTHRLRDTTRESYATYAKHITARIGNLPMRELKPAKVREFFRQIETELSGGMVGHVLTVLREMSRAAVADEILTADPTTGVKIAGRESREMSILTPEEYARVYDATPEHYKSLIRLLWSSGLRWGEAMGLKADCIVQDVHGRWVVVVKRTLAQVNGRPVLRDHGKTKNATRNVTIPADLAQTLLDGAESDGHVFRAPRGGFISRSNFRHVWVRVCADAGVSVRVHDLRHSHASLLANSGVNLLVVCKRLGHSDLKVTSRYLHLIDDGTDPALDVLLAA